jgi:NADP-dependent 3-hydroxy acid dehydrogenase YdfG
VIVCGGVLKFERFLDHTTRRPPTSRYTDNPMLDPNRRVILVSGATRGIGLAVAQTLYKQGYTLSLGARDPSALATLVDDMDASRAMTARYDADDWHSHQQWVDETAERFGRIDGLVNNAGLSIPITIRTADEKSLDTLWSVNCKAPFNMIRCALPHLEASGSGRVINIASLSGKRVANDHVGYAMTKFAVMALTHATRRIGWDRGVRACAICPGFVRTEMTAKVTKIAHGDMIDPGDLAEMVAMVIALPNSASVAELLVNCQFEATL